MPSPKLGMVITEKTNLQNLYDRLQNTVHIQTKKNQVLQLPVGSEENDDEVLANNIKAIHEALLSNLPTQQNNIKNMGVKLTMGKLVEV
jgi:large subunit ribosomal protein L1